MNLYNGAQSYQRPAKQKKIASQRQYRVKEGDGFEELKDAIRSVTGETPQTRHETLKKAAELLWDLSREHGAISMHEPLPPAHEPPIIPNETWKNAIASRTRNSSPDTSVTSSALEYQGHPQTEIHHIVGGGGNWSLVQPTPSQFRHNSSPGQWNDMSLIHSNIDRVPYYLERK